MFQLGLYLLSMAALYRLVWILPSKTTAFGTVAILGIAAVLDPLPAETKLSFAIYKMALLALVDRSRWRPVELCVLAFLSGLGLLVKINQGLEGIGLLLVLLAAMAWEGGFTRPVRRAILAALCVLPLSWLILFPAFTGSLWGFGSYLRYGWEIVSGYSAGMGLGGPLWQAALACATIATTFLAILLVADDLRALWPGMAAALIVTFFVFKHAMVRQGGGHAPAFQMKFAVALLFLLVSAGAARDRRLILVLQLFSVAMACAITVETYPGFAATSGSRIELRQAYTSLGAIRHWTASWEKVGAANERNRSRLRLPDRFHQLIGNGTVDALPWDIDVVQANGWKWRPRPVFQSYNAYTPSLDRLNARHLESDRTADFAILNFSAIDGRHPFLETPLSWRALLNRYDLKLSSPEWLVLQHRNQPRYGSLVPLSRSIARWDDDIPLPESAGVLVMGPRIEQSVLGHAMSVLFRPAPVFVETTLSSGRKVSWRSVPRNLAAGFIVRPFPQDLQEVTEFFLPDLLPPAAEHIVSVRFHTSRQAEFAPQIPIEWSALPLRTEEALQNVPRYPFAERALTSLWRAGDRPPLVSQARMTVRRQWIEVTPVTADPQLLFEIGPRLGRFQTLIVRAWFQKADRIDAFFGKQVAGRGVSGVVPVTGQWLDVYLNMSQNLFWEAEHGNTLRFDPVSSAGPGTAARIASVWGSTEAAPAAWPDVQFYPVPPSQAPKEF